jgi:hypothetical protein
MAHQNGYMGKSIKMQSCETATVMSDHETTAEELISNYRRSRSEEQVVRSSASDPSCVVQQEPAQSRSTWAAVAANMATILQEEPAAATPTASSSATAAGNATTTAATQVERGTTSPSYLVTGFPGFVASALVESLIQRFPRRPSSSFAVPHSTKGCDGNKDADCDDTDHTDMTLIHCVVQPKFRDVAEARAAELEAAHVGGAHRIVLYNGDITHNDLGLRDCYADLQEHVTEVFHLAAVYDLAMTRPLGMAVNVRGTKHVLDFAKQCRSLRCLHYVSTCYVSGRVDGPFTEQDLEMTPRQVCTVVG